MLTIALLGACVDDRLDVELMWEGDHVRVWRERGSDIAPEQWCPATFPSLDTFTVAVGDEMGVPAPGLLDYVVLPELDGTLSECDGNAGCTTGSWVYTGHVPHQHEVVHAVRNDARSSPHFFEEGAASYFGDLRLSPGAGMIVRDDLPTAAVIYDTSWARRLTLDEYEVAAQFTAFLVDEFGPDLNADFFGRSSRTMTRTSVEATFLQVFAEPLGVALERYETDWPRCSHEAARSSFFDCSAEAIVVCDGTAPRRRVFEFEVGCTDPSTLGPRAGQIWRDVVFEVLRPGPHEVVAEVTTADDEAATAVTLKRCSTNCEEADPRSVPIQSGGNLQSPLDAVLGGRHVFRIHRDETAPGPVTLIWTCGLD